MYQFLSGENLYYAKATNQLRVEPRQQRDSHIDRNKVNLRMTMLPSLGGRHIDDLARSPFDDDVPTDNIGMRVSKQGIARIDGRCSLLPQRGTLHGESKRGTGTGLLKSLIVLFVVAHNVSER